MSLRLECLIAAFMPMPSMPYRGRFAPSPTGQLHLGSLLAAVGSWLRARWHGGTWLVRIEDLDPEREVAGADIDMIETLARFGMQSDEPVLWQSERSGLYRAALEKLAAAGLAYRCACSRRDLESFDGIHPAHCVNPVDDAIDDAWRVRTGHAVIGFDDVRLGQQSFALDAAGGDFVIWRREGWAAYQLAVVIDDAAQAITEVVRGSDLLDSTPRQIWLQRQLGLPQPGYLHLPLVRDQDGRKLSKQDHSLPVAVDDPMPALSTVLDMLGLPIMSATTPAAALDAALHHPDWSDSALASPKASANVALQREISDSFGQTGAPSPPIRTASIQQGK